MNSQGLSVVFSVLAFEKRKSTLSVCQQASDDLSAVESTQKDRVTPKNMREEKLILQIDPVTVFDAILTSRDTCEKLQCLYENLKSNNFRKTAVLKKI